MKIWNSPLVVFFLFAGTGVDARGLSITDLDVRTPQGFTPLSMALIVSNYDTAEALIDAGARLSAEGAKKLLDDSKDNARLTALVKRARAK